MRKLNLEEIDIICDGLQISFVPTPWKKMGIPVRENYGGANDLITSLNLGSFLSCRNKVGHTLNLEKQMQELNHKEIDIVSGGPQEGNINPPF